MIIIEDDFPLLNGFDSVIPLTLEENLANGTLDITVYPALQDFAETFKQQFSDDAFSKEALSFINKSLLSYISDNGYKAPDFANRVYKKLKLSSNSQINNSVRLNTSQKLEKGFKFTSLLSHDLSYYLENGLDCFATVIDGKIVSACWVNPTSTDECSELAVETAPAFRKMGFAPSNISALCEYLLSSHKAECCTYFCAQDNLASERCAIKAGFEKVGRIYWHVCYLDD